MQWVLRHPARWCMQPYINSSGSSIELIEVFNPLVDAALLNIKSPIVFVFGFKYYKFLNTDILFFLVFLFIIFDTKYAAINLILFCFLCFSESCDTWSVWHKIQ